MKPDNLIFIETAMQHPSVVKLVQKTSQRLWHRVKDETVFEYACYREVGKVLLKEDVRSVAGIAKRIVSRIERWFLKNRQKDYIPSLESLAVQDDNGDEHILEIADDSSNTEDLIERKDVANLLAEGSDKKRMIVDLWLLGCNDSEISEVLAETFGGKKESHRKAVQRFKRECREKLSA